MKLRSENLWKLRTAIINRPLRLQVIICHEKEILSSLSSIKLVLRRYKVLPVQTDTMNEWCKILTIKTLTKLTELNGSYFSPLTELNPNGS